VINSLLFHFYPKGTFIIRRPGIALSVMELFSALRHCFLPLPIPWGAGENKDEDLL
jgi:hypothetical protein